jgi:hypothetical protein
MCLSKAGALLKRCPNCGQPSNVHGKFWHSAHDVRFLPWTHKLAPPHCLHSPRRLLCSQMPDPAQALHCHCFLPCSQKPDPLHALQLWRCFPCVQTLPPPQVWHRVNRFPWGHFFLTRLTRCTGCGTGGGGTEAEDADAMAAGKRQMKADVGYIAFS